MDPSSPPGHDGSGALAPPDLTARDASVLDEMARADDALLGFQGLRRRLGIHQQALTRSLRRLQASGFVERTDSGYRLSDLGYRLLGNRGGPETDAATPLVMAKALLPPHVGADAVVRHLAHRWFKDLRWYGLSESPGETRLTWLVEPGGRKIHVRVAAGHLLLESEPDVDDPERPFASARALLNAVAELYGLAPSEAPATAGLSYVRGTAA